MHVRVGEALPVEGRLARALQPDQDDTLGHRDASTMGRWVLMLPSYAPALVMRPGMLLAFAWRPIGRRKARRNMPKGIAAVRAHLAKLPRTESIPERRGAFAGGEPGAADLNRNRGGCIRRAGPAG